MGNQLVQNGAGIPITGMHIFKNNQNKIPPELATSKVITWKWQNLEKVIESF